MTYDALWREDATEEETIECYQRLVDSGDAWNLEGHVGRTAMTLIEDGQIALGPAGHRDHYGNYIPSRTEVEPGSKRRSRVRARTLRENGMTRVSDAMVERAVAAMYEANSRRRDEQLAESVRVWGHPGSVTTVRPLTGHELARIALEAALDDEQPSAIFAEADLVEMNLAAFGIGEAAAESFGGEA